MSSTGDRQERGRCERCDRPLTPLEWQDGWMPVYTAEGQCEGEPLCPGPAVDWRARSLAAADSLARVTRERDALAAERDRLRERTHEIAAEADARHAPALRELAEIRRTRKLASEILRDGEFVAGIRSWTSEVQRQAVADVVAERDALVAEHADVMTVLSQYQPGGSPPAGDVLLAQWTLETLGRELASARALAASNAETMRACSREATELDRQLGAARAREAALREALAELWTWQATVQELPPDDVSERVKAALAKEST